MKAQKLEFDTLTSSGGIFVEHIAKSLKEPFLYHDFVMVAYIAHGEGFHEYDGNIAPVAEGDIYVINPNLPHRFRGAECCGYLELYCCYISEKLIKKLNKTYLKSFPELSDFLCGAYHVLKTVDTGSKELRNLFVRMLYEFSHCPAGYNEILNGYFNVLYTLLLRNCQQEKINPEYSSNRTVDHIIRYIHYNLGYKITIDDIASAHHLSKQYICRLFKKHTNMTVIEFINRLKVDKVCDLLANTDRSIETIADTLSYSPIYLNRLFRKTMGMSMNEYRKKYHYRT